MGKMDEACFKKQYGYLPSEHYFSPGRVNLIGEYTDIAGGHVLPMAIDLGISASVAPRKDKIVRVYSLGHQQEFSLEKLEKKPFNWINYIIGEFVMMQRHGYVSSCGLDIALYTTLPTGSGLSSSACLEVLIGTIINEHSRKKADPLDIVKISKENENEFMGVSSGIMDQFACKMGKEGKVIFLDTKTLDYKYYDFNIGNCDLVIMNSNRPRSLTDSKYNVRVKEMQDGIADLRKYIKVEDACSLTLEQLEEYKDKLVTNPNSYKRLRHLISDNLRTLKCAELLSEGKIREFAAVLNDGHRSVSKDFEVAGFELDTLCEEALKGGALGARMTGAGFGGCAIFVAEKEKTENVIEHVKKAYKEKTSYQCDCYITKASEGAHRLA